MLPFIFMLLWRLVASKDHPFDFTIIARDIDKPTPRSLQQAQNEEYNNIFPLQHVAAGCINQLLALHRVFGEQEEEQRFGFIAKKNLIFSRSKFERVIKDYGDHHISGSFRACRKEMKWLDDAAGKPDAKDSIYKVKRMSSGEYPALQLVVKVKGRYAVMEFPIDELEKFKSRPECMRLTLAFDQSNVWKQPGWTPCTQSSCLQNCCTFKGVECDDGKITSIKLENLRLTGTIEWRQLPRSLEFLHLMNNQLSGTVQWTDLPQSLILLDLRLNQFDGAVEWEALPKSLQFLDLSDNRFSGAMEWKHFSQSLISLFISEGQFDAKDVKEAQRHLGDRLIV